MWLGRRYRSVRAWFGRQPGLIRAYLLLCAALVAFPCWCCCGGPWLYLEYHHWFTLTAEDRAYRRTERAVYPDGVPSVARRLKAEMEPISDPETALRLHPEWDALRFPNGEWVFGHGINSHEVFRHGRGTQVVKDSRGRIRIFFGHVCGDNCGTAMFRGARSANSLDDFYRQLQASFEFREWVPDQ